MKHFDPSRHLGSPEEIAACVNAILDEEHEPGALARALDDVAHAIQQSMPPSTAEATEEGRLRLEEWTRYCRAERAAAAAIARAPDVDALLLAIDETLQAAERTRTALKGLRAHAVRRAQGAADA